MGVCPVDHNVLASSSELPPPECPAHQSTPTNAAATKAEANTEWPRAPKDAQPKPLKMNRDQPNIDHLLQTHAADIAALKTAVSNDQRFLNGASNKIIPYDEIWLLRFILSNGPGKSAEKAVRATLDYRAKNATMLANCAAGKEHPLAAEIAKFSISEIYNQPTEAEEPVQLVRAGKSNMKKLMDTYSSEEVIETMIYQKEQAFLRCDEATRRTRKMIKMMTVVDMHSQKFSDNDKRFYKALGKASKDSELFYPQLLAITVGINVPSYMNLIWPIAKRVMPAKTLAKFRICSAKDTVTQSAVLCPFATTVFQPSSLVEFLGGEGLSTEVLGPVDRPKVL